MMWRTVATLSALWVVLTIVPAAVTTALFNISTDTPISGAATGAWIVGYLLQFAVFFVISRKSPHDLMVGWFVASIMPFVADWVTPVSWWALAICTVIVIGYATWLTRSVYSVDLLRRDGVRAKGVVVGVNRPLFNQVINDVYIRRTLRLRIERPDGVAPYEARLKATFMLGQIPEPGARLSVLVDPARPQHIELVGRNATSPRTRNKPQASEPDVTEQLRKLTTMHNSGDLTDAEFAAAKKRLLGT
jgi:Short C-terminal domain